DKRERIPRHYSTQMQVMINALNSMPLSDNKVSGSNGISVLMANSLMFQRFPTHAGYEDPQLANFYGQALPFLKRGVPIKTVHIENLGYKDALSETKVLLMSYSNMKPLTPDAHQHIAQWVKNGGILVYSGRDDDPFQTVQEWWNTNGNSYAAPANHLFEQMDIPAFAKQGEYTFEKGTVYIIRTDPKEFVLKADNDELLTSIVKKLYEVNAKAGKLLFKNSFYLARGMYDLIAVLDEGISDEAYTIKGTLVDLFDPKLPVYRSKMVHPGEQAFFLNIDRVKDKSKPQVLAGASRVYHEKVEKRAYSFVAKSPVNTTNVSRVLLHKKPTSVVISGKEVIDQQAWDKLSNTYLLEFENNPEGVSVMFRW
ncbi:hypothetical protein JGH11_14350, partial [Dysgonomonas sp. Marseille-P4677]|nr:hypothetical protein [Dysgonomonas sp. Marseille-P4677]